MRYQTLLTFMAICLVSPLQAAQPSKEDKTYQFAPVTFSLGCSKATRQSDRRTVDRDSRAIGYFDATQCIDASKQVKNVKVMSVAIGQNEALGIFEVIVQLGSDDAKRLTELTSGGNPQLIVLSVNGRAIVAGFNEAPFRGSKYSITANTLEEARRTADLFNK